MLAASHYSVITVVIMLSVNNVQKPLSLLSLLDDESNFAEASDLTFVNRLKNLLEANNCFKGERGMAFSVRHYAGEVSFCPAPKEFWNLVVANLIVNLRF